MPTIFKGAHFAWPLTLGIGYKKTDIAKLVTFDESCRYKINGEDMFDINKLFGIGYFFSHHTDSARFGWRYNPDSDEIELFAYCYVDKERIYWLMCELQFNRTYLMSIKIYKDKYFFFVIDANKGTVISTETITKKHQKKWSYNLGLYFGGNKSSPHRMSVKFGKP
jgi:hypothetical protein